MFYVYLRYALETDIWHKLGMASPRLEGSCMKPRVYLKRHGETQQVE